MLGGVGRYWGIWGLRSGGGRGLGFLVGVRVGREAVSAGIGLPPDIRGRGLWPMPTPNANAQCHWPH